MVYSLNGGLSGGNPNKRTLENGYHCSSLGNTPAYKPRKISAVRDFPQGCGRNTHQIISEPQQNVVGAVGEQGDIQSGEVMESSVRVNPNGSMVGVAIDANRGKEVVTQFSAATETNEFRRRADLEHQEIVVVPVGNAIPVVENADGTEASAAQEIQSQDDMSLDDDLVGKVVAMVTDGIDNQVEEKVLDVKPMDIELPKELEKEGFELSKELTGNEVQALVKRLENVDPLALVSHMPEEDVQPLSDIGLDREDPGKDESVPGPKNKFRRRRVSATRCFPPCCGRHAPPLAEEECSRIASGEKSSTEIEKGGEAVIAGGGETKANIGRGGRAPLPHTVFNAVRVKVYEEGEVPARKEIVLYEPFGAVKKRHSNDVFTPGHSKEHVIVNALMAGQHCAWRQGKVPSSLDAVKTGGRANEHISAFLKRYKAVTQETNVVKTGGRANEHIAAFLKKYKAVAQETATKADSSGGPSVKMDSISVSEDAHGTPGLPAIKDEEEYGEHGGPSSELSSGCTRGIEVTLPPYGASSSHGNARNKVTEKLHLFQTICRELLRGEEAKRRPEGRRIDLEAVKIMKSNGKDVVGKKYVGAVPGVEVGDEFQYRVELAIVGVHRLYQAGIDYMKQNGMLVAISIVSSGAYADDKEDANSLTYSGQGGNIVGKDKEPEDQKLERGNLALKNSITVKNPVRVVHGFKQTKASDLSDSKSKIVTKYVYDGLYTVENYWQEEGKHGKQVFMFKLKRIPGQPELAKK